MAFTDAAALARDLARNAEALCRHYLPAGCRQGRYWVTGDVHDTPGRSLFVRLVGPPCGTGAAGRWQDAATGQHGDLLDLIRLRCGLGSFVETAAEGRRFLGAPCEAQRRFDKVTARQSRPDDPVASIRAARRLFAKSYALGTTLAADYMACRSICPPDDARWLRFHPRCFCRPEADCPAQAWPAMVAAVTDLTGTVTAVHRTYLARDGRGKAPLAAPRRALGWVRGHAVRFGSAHDVLLLGEGLETVLSVVTVLPFLPAAAALSAANLAATLLPSTLRRLYVAQDNDAAGCGAAAALAAQARQAGIEPIVLRPGLGDFNDELRRIGPRALRRALRVQLAPEDVGRFLPFG